MKQQPTHPLKTIAITFLLSWLLLAAYANTPPTTVRAAPLMQASCTLPATVTTADQLYDCITAANAGSGGTITLGADIDLATLTTSPLPVIESTIVLQGAGHAIDGGWDGVPSSGIGVRIFNVAKIANLTINQTTLKNGYGIPGGAIFNNGPLFVSNSTFSNNWGTGGGAIYNFFSSGVVTVSNSTFTDNIAETIGGAINNSTNGQVTVTNSTFSGNSSGGQGGAINNIGGEVRSTSNTFYGNSASNLGDAIYSQGTSGWRLYLAGNIFVGNISGDNCRFQGGTIDDNGYNLSDDATCTNSGTGSATNATLSLGALADNGGFTQTHMPSTGSDAIGAIPNGTNINNNGVTMACNGTTTDQIGNNRPIYSGNACTAGAVEVPPPCPIWTVATADELYDCIVRANGNESPSPTADTITLGADIDLTNLSSSPLPQITSEITVEGAGYAIDAGGSSMRVFNVGASGDLTVNQATLQNGSIVNGGAIFNAGAVTLTSSTLSGNAASNGGVIYNATGSTLTATNSTFSGNSASSSGGVIYNLGTFTATSSTFSANAASLFGGSIYNLNTLHLAGNIFAAGSSVANCRLSGTQTDNGYNLSSDASCTVGGVGSATNVTLNLGALADNGGLTPTHLPGTDSAAIGAIPSGTTINNNGVTLACNQTTTDQLGADRPIDVGTACTSGAVEVVEPPCSSWTAANEDELAVCITNANTNGIGLDTITLGADITLSVALPQITSAITLEGAGYTIDGDSSVQLFGVSSAGNFTANQAILQNGFASNGGGIRNDGGRVTVTNSTFAGNEATAYGGGIYNVGGGTLTVTNSTFSGNSAINGGGIVNGSTLIVTNNTFAGNAASSFGSGIYNLGTAHLAGTIFADSPSGDNCTSFGTLTDNGYNLSDDASCGFSGTGSANNATLALGNLADNGGPTQTHLPGAGSNAIGAIPNGTTISNNGTSWTCDQSATDQRGELRPINSGDGCTAGAVEVMPVCTSWTVTTADELYACITLANANESPSPTADTITLGANITLTNALPQISSKITLEGAGYFVDGGNSVQIFNVASAGNFTINQATLQNGAATSGGAITNSGTLVVNTSTISGNTATEDGGGISHNGGTLTITNSTLSNNTATYGGGIGNYGTATVINSTFSGNSASGDGGGIENKRTLTVVNSTFSGNSAPVGGGIENDFNLTMTNSTFSGNSGSGLYIGFGTAHLAGNIFADGASGNNCSNNGTLTDNGYNLSDDGTCTGGGTGSATNATLNLGALADNGGSTQTHLPGAGSDAVGVIPNGTTISNNGTSWTCDQSATDQRGESRPINSGDSCSAGAVEVVPPPLCPSWTVTTANELSGCITLANANESPSPTADTITLGANITLTSALPPISSEITLEGAGYFIDGGNSVQIFNVASAGNFTVNQATLQNGSADNGGAITNSGTLVVSTSTISGNTATDDGGGIRHNGGTLTITNSTLSNNTATYGGGIGNYSTATVINSTFSGNSASNNGGGIDNKRTLTVVNSTFSGNLAPTGGGIDNYANLTMTNSTFSGNSGIGLLNSSGTVHLAGNIFADGASGNNCSNGGTLNDNGYNLSDDASCVGATPGTGSANNATLLLGNLADNGGPTKTHLPGVGSDAIGAIPNGTTISNNGTSWICDQSVTDQRGELRPINAGTACTAGAVEVARVQLTMQPNGYFSWLPTPSGSCSESLYRSSTPYVGHTWLTDDPANYDGSGSLTSVAINYFYYLRVDCGGSQSQSNEVGEFTFAIVPGN